jgi:hypothetical protein
VRDVMFTDLVDKLGELLLSIGQLFSIVHWVVVVDVDSISFLNIALLC